MLFRSVTEIEYGEGLAEIHPEILGEKGTVCPTSPFWWEFLRTKERQVHDPAHCQQIEFRQDPLGGRGPIARLDGERLARAPLRNPASR